MNQLRKLEQFHSPFGGEPYCAMPLHAMYTGRQEARYMSEAETKLPASIIARGQFTVTAASPEKRAKILRLIQKAGTPQLSTATWKAIEFYLKHGPEEDPEKR